MPYYDRDFVARVIEATDLADLIRSYFPEMRKVSGRWVGLCPFHVERSGSFGVREGKRFWKCFGCGAGGDAVKFLMQYENLPFPTAVERLAARASLSLPDGKPPADWNGPKKRKRTREQIDAEAAERNALAIAVRAERSVDGILSTHSWAQAEMWEDSVGLPRAPLDQARALLRLFKPSDVVWCGLHADSISPDDAKDPRNREWLERVTRTRPFRTAEEWCSQAKLPGPRICPNAMRAGALARSDASVQARRFLVVEHDKLGLDEQGAMLRWLSSKLKLRTVIFTGGKSLHGWFDCPDPGELLNLKALLCGVLVEVPGTGKRRPVGGMGFDASIFVPSQPYRVPGWEHDKSGKLVEMWYYAGGAQ